MRGTGRSSVDAREPQNPTKSEEYQRRPQGVLIPRSKDSQEDEGDEADDEGGKGDSNGDKGDGKGDKLGDEGHKADDKGDKVGDEVYDEGAVISGRFASHRESARAGEQRLQQVLHRRELPLLPHRRPDLPESQKSQQEKRPTTALPAAALERSGSAPRLTNYR
eukprot:1179638-Prorocentrum_minimum.AAC.7